ncbi:hypothetical protein LRU_00719 [Ligilactobacillus ruminis SPM0211]|uniref:Uncharacterized protein n=1 Tax=Ligilactobacillus ruminis SPM0211 TaxID=1040964 RepID=F7QZ77_9LACO|nr:hypothetical protein LRU_00719 [Ligilactobacillus ruminis SPM0211]KLA47938.1 hypothetical protein P869_06715 [Ligilactobacillus ruminis S23]
MVFGIFPKTFLLCNSIFLNANSLRPGKIMPQIKKPDQICN